MATKVNLKRRYKMKTKEEINDIMVSPEDIVDFELTSELERKAEDYLSEVTERLFDVLEAFDALYYTVLLEKRNLIQTGQVFTYQQGVLDVVEDLSKYARGERSLQNEKKEVREEVEIEFTDVREGYL
jgi:hypothetical protein